MHDWPEKLTGGCLCGAVRYETTMKPFKIAFCHCASCRKATAAPLLAQRLVPHSGSTQAVLCSTPMAAPMT